MISIIIPAHNECSVIARGLTAIVNGAEPNELEVIVVCNGCTDNTAVIARRFGPSVRVIETNIGNKTHALNLGDQAARGFPRIYVDADVVVNLDVIRALASRLHQGDMLAVAPRPSISLEGCSWLVRAYFAIRARLPSAQQGIGGSGVYALSEAGRKRFGAFPDVIADDGYVRIQFRSEERETLDDVISTVCAPRTIRDLITIRSRAHYGSTELAERFPHLWKNKGEANHGALIKLLNFPHLWPQLLLYGLVNTIARLRANRRLRLKNPIWERDNTSRQIASPAPTASGDRLP
jgi:glycosyltransferase involved in cell wall biosynthesis